MELSYKSHSQHVKDFFELFYVNKYVSALFQIIELHY